MTVLVAGRYGNLDSRFLKYVANVLEPLILLHREGASIRSALLLGRRIFDHINAISDRP